MGKEKMRMPMDRQLNLEDKWKDFHVDNSISNL